MKKKLLYIAPDHYGFYKVILEGLINHSDYDVHFIYSNKSDEFKYKNFKQRVYNFFIKNFIGKNLKKEYKLQYFEKKLHEHSEYDLLFINRPDIFSDEQLKTITKKCKKTIVYYWDSFEKIKGQMETMQYFDKVYSFDKFDCEKHNMIKGYNFFYISENISNPENDVFFIGTYDNRYNKLIKIIEYIKKQKLNIKATLYCSKKNMPNIIKHDNITFTNKIVPYNKAYVFNQNTKIILDIQHDNQVGLSFRPYEAMGLRKKLITTNSHIKNYDFYNPNNIFIWDENTAKLPDSFLNTPYEDIKEEIYNKYKLESWIKSILR